MDWFRRHLSFANVVSMLALFVALGGVSYAALKLPKNSVGSKQIKANAVKSGKVKNGSLRSKDFKAGDLPEGPQGPQGQPGTNGTNGTNGADGTARAFARIDPAGTLIGGADQSKGVVQANIQHTAGASAAEVAGTGVYCFGGLGFTPKSAHVALDNTDAMPGAPTTTGGSLNFIPSVAINKGEDLGYCDATHGDARVAIEQVNDTAAPTLANHGFFIWFE
jgi:hypothetical protein